MALAYLGIGSNLGDSAARVRDAILALASLGSVRAQSSLYRSAPWGGIDQPAFINAVVRLDTDLTPLALLDVLKAIERRLGRTPGERWGPRAIDLDILTYDDESVELTTLRIPHPHLYERGFVLVPLAEIDDRYRPALDALPASERDGVTRLPVAPPASEPSAPAAWCPNPRGGAGEVRSETKAVMSDEQHLSGLAERVRVLAQALVASDLLSVRVERKHEAIELARNYVPAGRLAELPSEFESATAAAPVKLDTVRADLVGIFHLCRPQPFEGERLEGDRELAYIEALGIRNPVRSRGAGRVAAIRATDGDPVEYGQPLFELDRG